MILIEHGADAMIYDKVFNIRLLSQLNYLLYIWAFLTKRIFERSTA